MLSCHLICFRHFGQVDLPVTTPLSTGNRTMQTFAKLPQSPPMIITNKRSTDEKKIL